MGAEIDIDRAAELRDAETAALIAAARRRRPASAETDSGGVCEDCERPRPRLIEGRCCFCIDGREGE